MAEDEIEDTRAPFVEHLRDLRKCITNSAIAVLVATGACLWWAQDMYYYIKLPLAAAWKEKGLGELKMFADSIPEPFMVYLKLGLYAGLFVASPFVFHQIWRFIAPGLYKKERGIALGFAIFSGIFFITGGLFCYFFVLPSAFKFFLGYATDAVGYLPNIDKYLDLVSKMLVAFGIAFELPLLIFFLAFAGIVTPRGLWKFNKYFVPIAFLVSAILTPPDLYSQFLMAVPLIGLYNLSIVFSLVVRRKRAAPPTDVATTDEP